MKDNTSNSIPSFSKYDLNFDNLPDPTPTQRKGSALQLNINSSTKK